MSRKKDSAVDAATIEAVPSTVKNADRCPHRDVWDRVQPYVYATIWLFTAFAILRQIIFNHDPEEPSTLARLFMRQPSQTEVCEAYLGAKPPLDGFSLILTADPGSFSGTAEARFILANLHNQIVKPTSETVCGGVYYGTLMGQAVAVVTTGIGPTAAALCVEELLKNCGPAVNDIIYFGTSGWSPQLGGVLNPPDCAAANPSRKITRLGDVCVSPVSVNWVCKKSTWTLQSEGFPNQCFRPEEVAGPNATSLYGECVFATDNLDANLALADSLIAAVRSARGRSALPVRNDTVLQQEARYWGLMAEGTGVSYPEVRKSDRPMVWDYRQCAEVDGQFFFTGAPWEIKARDYAAQAISSALGFGKPGSGERDAVAADEVIAVSAMEGVGVAEALEKYHRLSGTLRRIPYTNVRAASNWIHHPVGKVGEGQWNIYQEVPEDYVNGYAYAIATGSVTILSLFQQRCLAREELLRIGEREPGAKWRAHHQEEQLSGLKKETVFLSEQLQRSGVAGLSLWARAGGDERAGPVEGGAAVEVMGGGGQSGAMGSGVGGRRSGSAWQPEQSGQTRSVCDFQVEY